MATSTQTHDGVVLDRAGPENTDWRLIRDGDDFMMRKTIPYDGVRRYTTETRAYVSHRKSSRFNLSASQVVDLYREETDRDVDVPLSPREAVVERLDDADSPVGHADLVEAVEFGDGFDMGDVEDAIDDLLDEHRIEDVAPEREGPAYEVAI